MATRLRLDSVQSADRMFTKYPNTPILTPYPPKLRNNATDGSPVAGCPMLV